eukprot:g3788.t1
MAHLLHESLLLEVGREKQRIKAQRVERAERRIAGRLKDSVARKRSRMELEKAQRGDNRLDPRLDPFTRKDTRPQMLWDVPDDGACANGKAQPDRGRSVQTKTAKEKKKRRKAVTTEAVNLSDGSEGGMRDAIIKSLSEPLAAHVPAHQASKLLVQSGIFAAADVRAEDESSPHEILADLIEASLFNIHEKRTSAAYRDKFRSLVENLWNNPALCMDLFNGSVATKKLCQMDSTELANARKTKIREEMHAASLRLRIRGSALPWRKLPAEVEV